MRLQTWSYEIDNGIALLKRCSEEACNADDNRLLLELDRIIDIVENDARVRVMIITGTTIDGDISSGFEPNQVKFEQFLYLLNHVVNKLERLHKPKIAAIKGKTFNLFFELVLACDFRIAASSSLMGEQNLTLSAMPGGEGFMRLSRLIGSGRSNVIALTYEMIDTVMAEEYGLVNQVVADANLLEEAKKMALQILFRSSEINTLLKECN
ncbi:MAG: Enoyl-CoA hydratase/isomerase [Firmicutes bacterium]|nr:Enoyl-CoA hydratase/isomerase [Bacillota bacterium]